MTDSPENSGDEDTNPDLFAWLEPDFDGVTERVDEEYWADVNYTATGIRSSLEELIPDFNTMLFTPINEPLTSYANGGALAEDGYPLLLQPNDVDAYAAEHPEFRQVIERKVIEDMTPDRQQIEIDVFNAGDDSEQLQLLGVRKAELDYRASRIKFWTAVALLHPFEGNAVKERMGSKLGYECYDLDTRIDTLMWLEEKYFKFITEHTKLSRSVASLEKDKTSHHLKAQYAEAQLERKAEIEEWIKRIDKILTDICCGRLTDSGVSELETKLTEDIELNPEQLAIADLPGLDPVKLIFSGERQKIPERGWMFDIYVTPGESGVIIIYMALA